MDAPRFWALVAVDFVMLVMRDVRTKFNAPTRLMLKSLHCGVKLCDA